MSSSTDKPAAGPLLIGWKEFVEFPEWGIRRVKAKIDTGARTSALGVLRYELTQMEAAGLIAELHLALHRRHPERVSVIRVPVLEMIRVRNTSGRFEVRPLIEATARLGPLTKRIRLTITDRSRMRFPMILGRKALEGDFCVDVSQKYLLRKSS
jgi:hypothetical protein